MKKKTLGLFLVILSFPVLLSIIGCGGGGGGILPSEDVTGSWVSRDFAGAGAVFNFLQSTTGGVVTGIISDIDADYEVSGRIRGNDLDLSGSDMGVNVNLNASVTSNTMSGSWSKSNGGSGSFSALRVI